MRIDNGSLVFNVTTNNGNPGGTPSWGTSIVVQDGNNKIKEDDEIRNIIIGMIYKKIDEKSHQLSLPLGRGGRIFHGDDNSNENEGDAPSVPYLAAKFDYVFVNNNEIQNTSFVLLIVKDRHQAHNGRLQLKYSPNITWNGTGNRDFFANMRNQMRIADNAPLIFYDISVRNQEELHFRCIIDDCQPAFENPNDMKNYINNYIERTDNNNDNMYEPANDDGNDDADARQIIFYGAPGTGKSHKIKEMTRIAEEKGNVFRTTFHPDSDYSTFVGVYKPIMKKVGVIEVDGQTEAKKEISYQFVPQVFLLAYIRAWKNPKDTIYLVIEEINRGNCAQIFGDLFQLLDRAPNGKSEYPIWADTDLCNFLREELGDADGEGITNDKLKLPANLHILATMNTSDQSLFPIDSAFKRRWDWEYVPIKNANKGWKIINGHYDWWKFLENINAKISAITQSEDKQLGYFFVKLPEDETTISAKLFVSKVLFYLYNDVYRDFGYSDFGNIQFAEFFNENSVDETKAIEFLNNVMGAPHDAPAADA
jgi:MoxR-like ATPase